MAELTRLSVSSTLCSFQYLSKLEVYVDVKPYFFSGPLKSEHESMRTNLHYTEHEGIPVRDVRGSEDELNIDMHGFCSVRRESSIDLSEPDDTATVAYIRETCETIRELFNAEHVVCYDYRYRKNSKCDVEFSRGVGDFQMPDEPTRVPHVDLTSEGALRRIQRHLTAGELERYPKERYRFRVLNTWRPITATVKDSPLAFCDYKSIDREDLVVADRVSSEYVGEVYYLQYNEQQHWYYLKDQSPTEMAIFTSYDSDPVYGVAFCPHAAFIDRTVGTTDQPRRSIETRTIVITKLND